MPLLLPSILSNAARTQQPFILLQSSLAQSCLSVLRNIIAQSKSKVLLFCFLYPPSALLADDIATSSEQLEVFDLTDRIPGYSDEPTDCRQYVQDIINKNATGPFTVVLDSVDTLMSNLGSLSATQVFLSEALAAVVQRGTHSRLVVHMMSSSALRDVLSQTRFSASLTSLTAHPPVLLTHVATEYMTPPPPLSPPEKFWGVFLPISQRHAEVEKLVFGPDGEGSAGKEIVVEVLVRGADGSGRRRGIERELEGWSLATASACELHELESLKVLWSRRPREQLKSAPDPTQNVSFNLNLTPEQQQSRAQVPLPYLPEVQSAATTTQAGAIFYDPDSADDIDDDDPDEDLDI